MIYDRVAPDTPLQQGDIFFPVPFPQFDPLVSPLLSEDGTPTVEIWRNARPEVAVVAARVKRSWAIVASQDCDAARAASIALMEIDELGRVSGETLPSDARLDKWVAFITKHPKINPGWFYLPADTEGILGFQGRMAVDFGSVFQLPRESLVANLADLRRGRLKSVALDHFRHSMAFYFTRFAFDDWYTMTRDELAHYARAGRDPPPPFDWQR